MSGKAKTQAGATPEENGAAPATVETLQEQLNAANQALADEQAAHNATKEELKKHEEALKAANQELDVAAQTVQSLEAKVSEAKAEAVTSKKVITVNKRKYEVAPGNYSYQGATVNAEVLGKNPKLAEELVELGAGFIKPMED